MASRAKFALLPFMYVVVSVAGVTLGLQFLAICVLDMATFAGQSAMLAMQWKLGVFVMIKLRFLPTFG